MAAPAAIRRPTIFVTTVYGGGKITAHNAACLEGLRTLCAEKSVGLIVSRDGGTGTDRARNRQVARFLETGADAMLQVDDDIVFDPMDVLKMFWTGLPVIGAAYPCKEIDWERVAQAVKNGVTTSELALHASRPICNNVLGGGRVYEELGGFTAAEIGELPTGFLMVRREALIRYIEHYRDEIEFVTDYPPVGAIHHMVFACERDPRCAREMAKSHMLQAAKKGDTEALLQAAGEYRATIGDPSSIGRYLTEDYRQTVMWRLMGEKAYLAIDVKLTHIGVHPFVGDVRKSLGLTVMDPTAPAQASAVVPEKTVSPEEQARIDQQMAHTCAACGVRDPSSARSEVEFRCAQCGHRESAKSRGLVLPKVQPTNEVVPILDATEIIPGLFMGGYPPVGPALAQAGIATLVMTAAERHAGGPPEGVLATEFPGVEVIHYPFWDSADNIPMDRILDAASIVAEHVGHGKKVLVTCGEGRNRSGLVVALAMHAMTGMSGKVVIETIRSKRPKEPPCLSNNKFRALVEGLPKRAPIEPAA